ncbi:MAG: MAPEG family protein [Rubellimicrobium sp.]|nr:MAPEG family protein [Rubellimicrobium sp.]
MSAELTVLVLAAVLMIVQMALPSMLGRDQMPPGWAASPRDEPVALAGRAGRAERAWRNLIEALPLFIIAVVALTVADRGTGLTALLAWVWLAARVLYVPAYILGLSPWRSAIWGVGFLANLVMLGTALI